MSLIEIHSHLVAHTAEIQDLEFGAEEKTEMASQIIKKAMKPLLK